jgi:hypothetical protein
MDYNSSSNECVLRNGVETPSPYKNDKYIGQVLIIQEKSTGNENESCPDDTAKCGCISFEFCQPMTFHAAGLLDVDRDESADSKFVYASVSSKTLTVSKTGDNGYGEYNYNGIWKCGKYLLQLLSFSTIKTSTNYTSSQLQSLQILRLKLQSFQILRLKLRSLQLPSLQLHFNQHPILPTLVHKWISISMS